MASTYSKANTFLLLDMTFCELHGVSHDYDDPDKVPEIQWVVSHASYPCKDNGESGVYDFIFNLNMLDSYAEESTPPAGIVEQLSAIRDAGYAYILFNQGC